MQVLAERSGSKLTATVDSGVREGAAIRFYELTELSRTVPFGAFLDARSATFPQDAA